MIAPTRDYFDRLKKPPNLGSGASKLLIQRELLADISDGVQDFLAGAVEVAGGEANAVGDALHLLHAQTAGGGGGGADADAGGDGGLGGIAGDGVLVQGDVVQVALGLQILAGDAHGAQVGQHQVVVSATSDQVETFLQQAVCQNLGVLDHVLSVGLERGGSRNGRKRNAGSYGYP